MDVLNSEQRHKNMCHIKSVDTRPEIILRQKLWRLGYRYRKNYKKLPGKPDIVLTKYRICIFVDSEFFHGKGFLSDYESKKYSSLEEQLQHSNHPEFWLKKIRRNMDRDREVTAELNGLGWTVIRFWSKDIIKNPENCLQTIKDSIFEQYIQK